MTYKEYDNIFLESSNTTCPVPSLSLENTLHYQYATPSNVFPTIPLYEIYVATKNLGVYYSNDFVDTSTQPTWTAINTGLDALDCLEFHVDPLNSSERQYVLIDSIDTLYKRENGGDWTEILSPSVCADLFDDYINDYITTGFCVDPVLGTLWALIDKKNPDNHFNIGFYVIHSDNYGTSWVSKGSYGKTGSTGTSYSIRSNENYVFISYHPHTLGTSDSIRYSTNVGTTWSDRVSINSVGNGYLEQNILEQDSIYASHDGTGNFARLTVPTPGDFVDLFGGIHLYNKWGCLWCNNSDVNHQRLVGTLGRLYVTNDKWVTTSYSGTISPTIEAISAWHGGDINTMFVGIVSDAGQDHTIGVLYGENDTSVTGISGTNCGSSPYTNSIPKTTTGVARCGIQAKLIS